MGDDIWEYYAKDMMFESHKEPHYVTQQYIKHLERERDKWRGIATRLISGAERQIDVWRPNGARNLDEAWISAWHEYDEAVRGD